MWRPPCACAEHEKIFEKCPKAGEHRRLKIINEYGRNKSKHPQKPSEKKNKNVLQNFPGKRADGTVSKCVKIVDGGTGDKCAWGQYPT